MHVPDCRAAKHGQAPCTHAQIVQSTYADAPTCVLQRPPPRLNSAPTHWLVLLTYSIYPHPCMQVGCALFGTAFLLSICRVVDSCSASAESDDAANSKEPERRRRQVEIVGSVATGLPVYTKYDAPRCPVLQPGGYEAGRKLPVAPGAASGYAPGYAPGYAQPQAAVHYPASAAALPTSYPARVGGQQWAGAGSRGHSVEQEFGPNAFWGTAASRYG